MKVFETNLSEASMLIAASMRLAVLPAPHPSAYLTPLIAAIAAFVAWRALRSTRAVARQKATLDLIEKRESTEHYRRTLDRFSALRKSGGFEHLNDPKDGDRADRGVLIDYLNHYELVAIGLRQGILDARIYRAWIEGSFVRDWNAVAAWVQRERWKQDRSGGWTYRGSIMPTTNASPQAGRPTPSACRPDQARLQILQADSATILFPPQSMPSN